MQYETLSNIITLFVCLSVRMSVRYNSGTGFTMSDKIFKGSSRAPRNDFRHTKFGSLEYGARKLAFFIYGSTCR